MREALAGAASPLLARVAARPAYQGAGGASDTLGTGRDGKGSLVEASGLAAIADTVPVLPETFSPLLGGSPTA